MRAMFVGAALAATLALSSAPEAAAEVDPLTLYGAVMEFDIRRNGRSVGSHRLSFTPQPGGAVTVAARSEIAVRFLGITAYRFTYDSRTLWRDGAVETLTARTDDGGTVSDVRAVRDGGVLRIEGPQGRDSAPGTLFPTDHWHPGVASPETAAVLNTITGRVNAVTLTPEAEETVETAAGPRPARRWRYGGELDTVVWYDAAGRWVGLRFAARDGSVIDYVCRVCGVPGQQAEGNP